MARRRIIDEDPFGDGTFDSEEQRVLDALKAHGKKVLENSKIFGIGATKFAFGASMLSEVGLTFDNAVEKFSSVATKFSLIHIASRVLEGFQTLDTLRSDFSRELSLTRDARDKLAVSTFEVYQEYSKWGISLDHVAETSRELIDILKTTSISKSLIEAATYASSAWNLSSRSAANIVAFSDKFFNVRSEDIKSLFEVTAANAQRLELSAANVLDSLGEYPILMLRFNIATAQGREALSRSLGFMNKIGKSISESVKMSDEWLNIETAIEKSAALAALGVRKNPLELIRLAASSPGALEDSLYGAISKLGVDITNQTSPMSRIYAQGFASALGMETEELIEQMVNFNRFQKMSYAEQISAKEAQERARKLQEDRNTIMDQLKNRYDSFINWMVIKLGPPVLSMADVIMKVVPPLFTVVSSIFNFFDKLINSVFPDSFGKISSHLEAITKIVLGIFIATKLRSIVQGRIDKFAAKIMTGGGVAATAKAASKTLGSRAGSVAGAAAVGGASILGKLAVSLKNLPETIKFMFKKDTSRRVVSSMFTESLGRSAASTATKVGGRGIAGVLGKKLPFGIGALLAAGFAVNSLKNGDTTEALMNVASGLASIIPGIGTAASFAIDASIMGRSVKKSMTDTSASVSSSAREVSRALDKSLLSKDERDAVMAKEIAILRKAMLEQHKRDIERLFTAQQNKASEKQPLVFKVDGRTFATALWESK